MQVMELCECSRDDPATSVTLVHQGVTGDSTMQMHDNHEVGDHPVMFLHHL